MQAPESFFKIEDFVPELREQFAHYPFTSTTMIHVAISTDRTGQPIPFIADRRLVSLTDGAQAWTWRADSLRVMFRGNKQPPVLGDYPPEAYSDCLMFLELHALEMNRIRGDRTDSEMKEIYATLRRRPDGRSLGFEHDYMWQAAALLLGMRPLSQAEFEAITSRLERSCRTFEMGPASRNYIATLRATLGEGSG